MGTRAIQYRLGEGAARDAAAHFNGGVPAWEAERVRQELAPQREISAPDVVVTLQLASRGKKEPLLTTKRQSFRDEGGTRRHRSVSLRHKSVSLKCFCLRIDVSWFQMYRSR